MGRAPRAIVAACILASLTAACGDVNVEKPPHTVFDPKDQRERERSGSVFGEDGLTFSTGGSDEESSGGGGLGVNAYLWRGTLETIDFLPLASADPFGGLIISDWYQPVETPAERLKVHVLIKDAVLRADALKVSVFRQRSDGAGGWLDAPIDASTARALEDKILTRARELRIAEIGTTG